MRYWPLADAPYAEVAAPARLSAYLRWSHFPEIGPTCVGSVSVNEIDFKLRPPASLVEPGEATRLVKLPVYTNLIVPSTPISASNTASKGAAANSHPPSEFSGCWVVIQHFAQSMSG